MTGIPSWFPKLGKTVFSPKYVFITSVTFVSKSSCVHIPVEGRREGVDRVKCLRSSEVKCN